MASEKWDDVTVERRVTYSLEVDGKIVIVKNVPARVCPETGERLFSPETMERLRQVIQERRPDRLIQVLTFE